MSRTTPCPDLMHLRLFFHKPASAPDAESVRAHVEQCKIAERFWPDSRSVTGSRIHWPMSRCFSHIGWRRRQTPCNSIPKSEIAAAPAGGTRLPHTLADARYHGRRRSFAPCADASPVSLVGNGVTAMSTTDATVFFSAGLSENDGFELSPAAASGERNGE